MPLIPDSPRRGQKVRASDQKRIIDFARTMQLFVAAPLMLIRGSAGFRLIYDGPVEFWAKITEVGTGGNTGKFGWERQQPRAVGSWVNLRAFGTVALHPAFEVNLAGTAQIGDKVWIRYEPGSNEPRFQLEKCGPGSGGGGGGSGSPTPGKVTPSVGFFFR